MKYKEVLWEVSDGKTGIDLLEASKKTKNKNNNCTARKTFRVSLRQLYKHESKKANVLVYMSFVFCYITYARIVDQG